MSNTTRGAASLGMSLIALLTLGANIAAQSYTRPSVDELSRRITTIESMNPERRLSSVEVSLDNLKSSIGELRDEIRWGDRVNWVLFAGLFGERGVSLLKRRRRQGVDVDDEEETAA